MNQSKSVYILQHIPTEDAGTIRDYLEAKHLPFQSVQLYMGESLPKDLSSVHSVVIMGGPMNVNEVERYPFLRDEAEFLKRCVVAGVPCLGVCLGSQLLAKALGASVYKAPVEEIGWDEVEILETAQSDALFGPMAGSKLKVLQWHGDTFDLPKGAVWLAKNGRVPHQAFRFGDRVYGLQFHVEVNRQMLEDWFKKRSDLPNILSEFDAYFPALTQITNKLYQSFFRR